MSEDEGYVCTLDSASLKKAKEELHEDPKERLSAVATLRAWVLQQKHLKTPTNTRFLLQMLRARKFSQLGARELIEKYWKLRTKHERWYRGTDPTDPKVQYVWEHGVYYILPGRDKEGRKVILARIANIEITGKNYNVDEYMRGAVMLFEAMLYDEDCQVNGMVMIMDMSDFAMKHQNFFGMENSKTSFEIFQTATPVRMKGIHYYKGGPVFDAIMELFKPFMKEKIRKRVMIHGQSLVTLYEHVDMAVLPKEYLPDDYTGPNNGTIEEILKKQMDFMRQPEIQSWLKILHDPKYGYEEKLKVKDDVPAASFRKLNVS